MAEAYRFRHVLVPLDGSALAEHALSAVEFFKRAGAQRVGLVRALGEEDSAAEAVEYLKQTVERLGDSGLAIDIATPRGKPAEAILDEVKRQQADVLAMTTHGRSGLGRWLYGSVAEAVLEHTPVPVFLSRAWQRDAPAVSAEGKQRVLVPLDGSPLGEAVLPIVADLAGSPLAAEVVLLRVVEPPQQRVTGWVPGVVYSDVGTESEQAEALSYLNAVASRLSVPSIEVDVRVGRSIDSILAAAGEHGCTLVCMVTHAQSGIGRVIVGTVTDGVLRGGSNPLLLVRPES